MAKMFNRSIVTVLTFREDGGVSGVPADVEYHVRNLGRGRWLVEDEDGAVSVLRTSALQRFFCPRSYEHGYWSSGEPVWVYEEVQILKA